jgi:hypothetical protein
MPARGPWGGFASRRSRIMWGEWLERILGRREAQAEPGTVDGAAPPHPAPLPQRERQSEAPLSFSLSLSPRGEGPA